MWQRNWRHNLICDERRIEHIERQDNAYPQREEQYYKEVPDAQGRYRQSGSPGGDFN